MDSANSAVVPNGAYAPALWKRAKVTDAMVYMACLLSRLAITGIGSPYIDEIGEERFREVVRMLLADLSERGYTYPGHTYYAWSLGPCKNPPREASFGRLSPWEQMPYRLMCAIACEVYMSKMLE